MRIVTVIRHGHSTANDSTVPEGMSAGDVAIANRESPLTDRGRQECATLAALLLPEYDIDVRVCGTAVSEYKRAQQSARALGFEQTVVRPQLNEAPYDMPLETLRAMLRQNQVPATAVEAAKRMLADPPPESVWITHGLLIAGMCIVLGVDATYEQAVPRQCEVRQLSL